MEVQKCNIPDNLNINFDQTFVVQTIRFMRKVEKVYLLIGKGKSKKITGTFRIQVPEDPYADLD